MHHSIEFARCTGQFTDISDDIYEFQAVKRGRSLDTERLHHAILLMSPHKRHDKLESFISYRKQTKIFCAVPMLLPAFLKTCALL